MNWNEVNEACPFESTDLLEFSSKQILEFLGQILEEEEPMPIQKLAKMDELYSLNKITNHSEIRLTWIRIGLRGHWEDAIPRAIQMVSDQGRMKFLRPLYR